ncbi:hypothetical protein NPX13_g8880 [Xylaria arbuscula]|uniref:Gfd2/YDR514C-like C-terminal domain-containing protein n=1 Tax=Xylaria arbuscula TaxID=114810 RepID=A0A9W8N828_9PEZI|nr:hypothetical protein NPX13_g8880 [Xylaria arbuscula]
MAINAQLNKSRQTIPRCGLQILREALGLSKSTHPSIWTDSFLMAIDFENNDNIRSGFARGKECQVGVATLDTRDLQKGYLSLAKDIKTLNYISGSKQYIKKVSEKCLFAETLVVKPANFLKTIQQIIPQDQNRRVIIISHGAQNELTLLQALGYKFSKNMYVFDTFLVAKEAFGYGYSLSELLRRVRCPYDNLHNAGNDAYFTLRASLILALD